MIRILMLVLLLPLAAHAAPWPGQTEGDWTIADYRFASGETLSELKLHYTTLGTPKRDAAGEIVNAALLLHGTSGTGRNWLIPSFADEMFGPGQPLDLAQWYVVLPDGVGRGGSSKPSDGLRTKFPHYRYHDMVQSEYRLLTEHLGIHHVRLVLGASMGGMQSWMWAGMYPDFMDVAVPMASQPIRISGRNWINRRITIEAIRNDPDWHDGNYTTPPTHWVVTAPAGRLGTANVAALQEQAPDVEAGDKLYRQLVAEARKGDANDALYSTEAVMDYAPEDLLSKIRAKVLAINSADDNVNPPELGVTEAAIARIPGAQYYRVPASATTRGHYTYEQAALWKAQLVAVLGP